MQRHSKVMLRGCSVGLTFDTKTESPGCLKAASSAVDGHLVAWAGLAGLVSQKHIFVSLKNGSSCVLRKPFDWALKNGRLELQKLMVAKTHFWHQY